MTVEALGLFLDYSKNRITDETLKLLCNWPKSRACGRGSTPCFAARRSTSPRSARCCTWLCAPRRDASIVVDGENVVPQVHAVLDKMADFSNRVRSGEWKGHTGKRFAT
jgi:glucose-6-phosphate isomerase